MPFKSKVLWTLLFLTFLASASNIIGDLFNLSFLQIDFFNSFILYVPVLILILHSIWTLSLPRGMFFILITFLTGFIFEYFGLKNGVIFGGEYIYLSEGIKFLTVPVNVIFYWGVFIYVGYCITNSFLFWLGKNKPSLKKKDGLMVPLLVVADSLIVLAIDLFMDPIQV